MTSMRIALPFLCALGLGLSFVAARAAQPLLTPSEIESLATQPATRIVDVRTAAAYKAGHIPGAVSAPYAKWRGPAENPGKLPSIADLTHLVRTLGVGQGTHVLIVSSGVNRSDFGAATRVYWTLKYLGAGDLSILNGGMKAWAAAGLPQTTAAAVEAPTDFVAHLDQDIIAKEPAVAAQLGDPETLLLDARPHSYYLGEKKAPSVAIPGTIKGAVNFAYSNWFDPGTTLFVTPARARTIAAELKAKEPAKETIAFCNTGHWASIDWFALSEIAGEQNVRLYPQSLAGWTKNPKLPMQNVPSRSAELWHDITGAFK